MTASPLPLPRDLHAYLADPRVRRSLSSLVHARVPARDAEDVVQSVLCAALAAEAVPAATNIPRWIAGIARHKVADAHRRAYREALHDEVDAEVAPPAYELREIAERVEAECAEDAEASRALEWIAREQDGETWADIAKAERLPSTVVRKRISRFRRALRVRWLGALVLWIAAASAVESGAPDAIAPDDLRGATLVEGGDWRVERAELVAPIASERRVRELEAMSLRIHVDGAIVDITSPLHRVRYRIMTTKRDGDRELLTLRDDAGRTHAIEVLRDDASHVRVRISEGPWRGTFTLHR